MSFTSPYPPVSVQVRAWLAEARAAEIDFETAWSAIFRRTTNQSAAKMPAPVHFPHGTSYRHAELEVLEATKSEWRAAFALEPTPFSVAVARALEAMDDELDDSSFAAPAGAGVVRQAHVVPVAGLAVRSATPAALRLESRDVFKAMFARNDARRELRAA